MKHIEFMGAAGSGKSTLAKKLTIEEECLFSEIDLIYNPLFYNLKLQDIMPHGILKIVSRLFWSRSTKCELLLDFINNNPEFVSATTSFIQSQGGEINCEENSIVHVMAVYQLAKNELKDNEALVLDEGFYHKVAVHAKHGNLPSEQYFLNCPTPDVLIHVDPPIKVARERCRNRDGTVASRKKYQEAKQTKKRLASLAENMGVYVIEIDNTKNIESTINQIQIKMCQYDN